MSVVVGDYRRRFSDRAHEQKQHLIVRFQEIFGTPSFIEGTLWVWDLRKDPEKPILLQDGNSQDQYLESDFEQYIRSRSLSVQ